MKLNFGCGEKIMPFWDNIDIQESPKLTKSFDFDKFPYPLPDNKYDFILVKNVLEHLSEPDKVLGELWRISNNNSKILIIVPHYTHKGAYSDMTHKHFFNESCFKNIENNYTKLIKKNRFKITKLQMKPTIIGKLFPRKLREKLSQYLNGLIGEIAVELRVIKNENQSSR